MLKNNNFRIDLFCNVARLRSLLAHRREGVLTGAPVPIYPFNIRNTRIVIFFKLHFFRILLYWIFPSVFKSSANNKKIHPPYYIGSIVYI